MCIFDFYTKAMNTPNTQSKSLMRKILFLEITGIISLLLIAAVVYLILSFGLLDVRFLALPAAGVVMVAVFIFLTIRYTRRDLHKIHILHTHAVYTWSRRFMYAVALAMIVFPIYKYLTDPDFIGVTANIIVSELLIVLGVLALYYNFTLSYMVQHEHLRHNQVTLWDLFWVVLFPVVLVAGTVFVLFTEKASTSSTGEADYEISAVALIQELQKNDSATLGKYIGKVVKFGGVVASVEGDSARLLKLNTGFEEFTANCSFEPSELNAIRAIGEGDSILVQCSCSGLTVPESEDDLLSEKSLDMARCALIKKSGTKP